MMFSLCSLSEIVNYEKARSVLFGQWGFGKKMETQGIACLFHGQPGTGKTLAAEAIGFDLGKPLKLVNCAQLLSKWVGDTPKNIDALFQEAKSTDAVLVFDDAEGLFGVRSGSADSACARYANVDVSLLLYHIEKFSGVVILSTNLVKNIDPAFFRRMRFVLEFPIPSFSLRQQLWSHLLPKEMPRTKDIDFDKLAHDFTFAGGNIKSAILRAATRAALRPEKTRLVTMADLVQAAEEEMKKTGEAEGRERAAHMYT